MRRRSASSEVRRTRGDRFGVMGISSSEKRMHMVFRYFATVVVFAVSSFAQGNLGGFTGTITDTSRASVADARLTLTSYQTNSVHSAVADSEGAYAIRGL